MAKKNKSQGARRGAAARKGWATRRAEAQKRTEAARKGWETRRAAKRSEAARKGWETRRAKVAPPPPKPARKAPPRPTPKAPPAPPAAPPRYVIPPERYREIVDEWDDFDRDDWQDDPDESS